MLWIGFVVSLVIAWLLDYITQHRCVPVGGIAIGAAIIFPLWFNYYYHSMVLWSIFMAFTLGALDDLFKYGPWSKLLVEFAIASMLISRGYRLYWFPFSIDMIASAVWMVAMMNALNFMDNMDGLAAGLGIIAGGFFYITTRDPLALVMCGALAGFLLFNYQPASIYMGDSGSLMIGLILALLPMMHRQQIGPYPTLLILSVPLADMTRLCFARSLRGKFPWKGGRDHISHILAKRIGERRAVISLYAVAVTFGFLGV